MWHALDYCDYLVDLVASWLFVACGRRSNPSYFGDRGDRGDSKARHRSRYIGLKLRSRCCSGDAGLIVDGSTSCAWGNGLLGNRSRVCLTARRLLTTSSAGTERALQPRIPSGKSASSGKGKGRLTSRQTWAAWHERKSPLQQKLI